MEALDGNAIAGPLFECFGAEMTTARGICATSSPKAPGMAGSVRSPLVPAGNGSRTRPLPPGKAVAPVHVEFTEEHDALRRVVREYAEGEIAPHAEAWDRDHHFPVDVVRGMGDLQAWNQQGRVTPLEAVGHQVGSYKLLQPIGEGGMGSVWMAEQTQPVQRKVALKLIKSGMDSAQVLRRLSQPTMRTLERGCPARCRNSAAAHVRFYATFVTDSASPSR